jgi:DNA-binding NtrC family response regulator
MARREGDTLLAWHSVGHGAAVLTGAISLLKGEGIPITRVLLLVQPDARPAKEDLRPASAEIEMIEVKLRARDATRHRKIYEQIQERVLPRVRGLGGSLHINISPGTPAMHAVWLVLYAGGAFPPGTRLWSTQEDRVTRERYIDEVDFSLTTYLAEIRKVQAATPDRGHFDPEARSPRRREALEQLRRFGAMRRAPLLMLGERGTGKTRLIEDYLPGLKGRQCVVTVACGTLDQQRAESQIFGHVKGAFTGAIRDQKGYLQEAEGQILFLDEVQDLRKEVQRKLVRLLQDPRHRYRRLGSTKEEVADVEVVFASHKGLDALREDLDADLFDRISLLLIEWPPLRACREDLIEDFRRVWRELRGQGDLPAEPPLDEALRDALAQASLPGNLRDLQRLAYLLMTRHGSGRGWVRQAVDEWRAQQDHLAGQGQRRARLDGRSWKAQVQDFQRQMAEEAHARHGTWDKAAAALGVNERTLRAAARRKRQG